jgi:hypothetical protein
LPRTDGIYWFATDGAFLAWKAAVPPTTPNIPDGVAATFSRIVTRHQAATIWHRLPAVLPDCSATAPNPCPWCKGAGEIRPSDLCEDCDGEGECPHCGKECNTCDGTGRVPSDRPAQPCDRCQGTGNEPPPGVRLFGKLMKWEFARRLVAGKAQLAFDPDCRCPFLVRMDGVDMAVMDMNPDDELQARCPELRVEAA